MAKTYFWVCADVRKYDKGWRRNSLRTARKTAYHHLNTHKSEGYSEIAIETSDGVYYAGTVRSKKVDGKLRFEYHETFDPRFKMKGRMWVLKSDGTVGKLIRG